jgi:ribose-phosphate pyrophosphokinase
VKAYALTSGFSILLAASMSFASVQFDAVTSIRGIDVKSTHSCPGCEELVSKAVEFANGNTFVQYDSEIGGRSVLVLLPERMSADHFVEAILKIRTLYTLGASSIGIEVKGDADSLAVIDAKNRKIELPVKLLLSVAGAQSITDSFAETHDISQLKWDALRLLEHRYLPLRSGHVTSKETVVAPGSHPDLAARLSELLRAPLVQDVPIVAGKRVLVMSAPVAPVNESLLKTLAEIHRLEKDGAEVHLVSPYLPYARSDKMDQDGITTGGRLIAEMIEVVGARSITYARAHAPQSSGFFRIPQRPASSYDTIGAAVLESVKVDLVIAPDAGAQKDATKFADLLGVPVAVINKQRDGSTTRIRGISLPVGFKSLNGKRVLIIDDETASGSTLRDAAEYAKSLGAVHVTAAVTHLAGDAKAALGAAAIDKLVVTDSIPVQVKSDKVVVASLATELSRELRKGSLRTFVSCGRALMSGQ